MRRLRDTASVRIVEMLPGLDDLWLTDAEGNRFTGEIRTSLVRATSRGHMPLIADG